MQYCSGFQTLHKSKFYNLLIHIQRDASILNNFAFKQMSSENSFLNDVDRENIILEDYSNRSDLFLPEKFH